MKDPFPIPPIPALSEAVKPLADYLGLPTLPLHIHEVLITAAFYEFIRSVVSPALSSRIFPRQYAALSKTKKMNWDVHVVSFVQSTSINILALWVMFNDEERRQMDWQERLWGYSGGSAMIQALAAGYFVWDLLITATNVNVFGLGMLAHAVSALTVYSFGFRPFVNFYSTTFILWELSSPFLNIHWFCDKLGMTGSRVQLYNGLVLIGMFFSCRLVWGTWQSVMVYRDLYSGVTKGFDYGAVTGVGKSEGTTVPASYVETMRFVTPDTGLPLWLAVVYVASNLTLNSLNFYWFFKMIDAVRKRFEPAGPEEKQRLKVEASPARESEKLLKGAADGTAVLATGADGHVVTRQRRRTLLDGEDPDNAPPV
ncbi:TLC domain-containing protein [Poronia punctata]|nr:TLC domain-containing protein [Poronia punctata]